MKGKHIYEEIRKFENLKGELNQALNELENVDMEESAAYSIVVKERDAVSKELVELLNKEWDEAPVPKAPFDF